MDRKPIVITTINRLTEGMRRFASINGWVCIVVGDRKTPPAQEFDYPNIIFISYEDQSKLGFEFESKIPDNHYARKNIGYLIAIKKGAKLIAETDDDNIPYRHWGRGIDAHLSRSEYRVVSAPKLCNVYRIFSEEHVWPRGFPLAGLQGGGAFEYSLEKFDKICVWQGLADIEPDVDAIFRLVFNNRKVRFKNKKNPVVLGKGVYCPFNSQNTIWLKKAFVYLYLPLFVSFRFTDILRSYIAQKGIWAINGRIAFGDASVYQMRNKHNLMKDFVDEISCYTNVSDVIDTLDSCALVGNPFEDLMIMYQALNKKGLVAEKELESVRSWISCLQPILGQ